MVIHALAFLWETFLTSSGGVLESKIVRPISSMNSSALFLSSLILWSYAFATYGPESVKNEFKEKEVSENGIHYLCRIRQEIFNLSNINLNIDNFQLKGRDYNNSVDKLASCLLLVTNIHHLAGLNLLVAETLRLNTWERSKENANLLFHLFKRSLGFKEVWCREMYNIKREHII